MHWPNLNDRVEQPRRAHHLLNDLTGGPLELKITGRCRDEDGLRPARVPLLKLERAVVQRARQPKTMLDERRFTAAITLIHRSDLPDRDVALIHHQHGVFREVFKQGRRRLACAAPAEPAAVILDAGAPPCLFDHLKVLERPLAQPLLLEQLRIGAEMV